MYKSISLVVGTIGRTDELGIFLRSIAEQTVKNVEVIIVDQNSDSRISQLLYDIDFGVTIHHRKSEPGLSVARNKGLELASGDIVGFPDDDCIYPEKLLEDVLVLFNKHRALAGICGRICSSEDFSNLWRFDSEEGYINRNNVWRRSASASIFLTKNTVDANGSFDETLGLGAGTEWQAGEESDYLLRVINAGGRLFYTPELIVLHPPVLTQWDKNAIQRGYSYGRGIGRVIRRYWAGDPRFIMHFLRPLGGMVLSIVKNKLPKGQFHWAVLKGRLRGFFD